MPTPALATSRAVGPSCCSNLPTRSANSPAQRDIRDVPRATPPVRVQFAGQCDQSVLLAIERSDAPAALGEGNRQCTANAAGGSGDERNRLTHVRSRSREWAAWSP